MRFLSLKALCPLFCALSLLLLIPAPGWSLSSANIALDSPIYDYLGKLAGYGLITTDVAALRPYSKAEAARLVIEAEGNLDTVEGDARVFAGELLDRLEDLLSRELSLRRGQKAPLFDYNRAPAWRARYFFLDGEPRSYNRKVYDPANQSAFGFIGGNLRPQKPAILQTTGTEGTPLMENNEGIKYRRGSNEEGSISLEGYVSDWGVALVEPDLLVRSDGAHLLLKKGNAKVGGGGAELEVGRDANWFGPGSRGALSLTNNAQNFDFVKLSSPEPLDFRWLKEHIGQLKYALLFSRFDESGTGKDYRQPYFLGVKLSLKASSWFEIGGNFVRQEGGPGFTGQTSTKDFIFGGGYTNKSNSIAGFDLRFKIPQLRNTEIYGEYVGEDAASFWPFIESYVAGIYIPRLTASGRDDFRFEYLYGSQLLYTDFKFPEGYTYHDMTPGHSQGGGSQEFFFRYSHWFSPRKTMALEYFHTDRGQEGRLAGQSLEQKDAARGFYTTRIYRDLDLRCMYGWETIRNFNLVPGAKQTNQVLKLDLDYRY